MLFTIAPAIELAILIYAGTKLGTLNTLSIGIEVVGYHNKPITCLRIWKWSCNFFILLLNVSIDTFFEIFVESILQDFFTTCRFEILNS